MTSHRTSPDGDLMESTYREIYARFDAAQGVVPATGPAAITVLLRKALLALGVEDADGARRFVGEARGVPPGPGVPAPVLLPLALQLLDEELQRAADRDGGEWFDALQSCLVEPEDDVTRVALATMASVAQHHALSPWMAGVIEEYRREYRAADPATVVERVAAGRADEGDAVLAVLRVALSLEEAGDLADEKEEFDSGPEPDDGHPWG